MSLHRNTRWLLLLSIIVIMMVLQRASENETVRIGLLGGAILCIVDTALRSRKIEERSLRLWIRFALAELSTLWLWLSLNQIRAFTYDSAVENRPSFATEAYSWSIAAQDLLPWAALLVAILFLLLAIYPKSTTGLNTKNV